MQNQAARLFLLRAIENVQPRLGPLVVRPGCQFEDGAFAAAMTTAVRRAVQVPGCVKNQVGVGVSAVVTVEFMQYVLGPLAARAGCQLEDGAASIRGVTPNRKS